MANVSPGGDPNHLATSAFMDVQRPNKRWPYKSISPLSFTHRIHVWYIYLHLVDLYGKCRKKPYMDGMG